MEEMMSEDTAEPVELEEPQEIEDAEVVEEPEEKPEFKTTRDKPPEGFVPHQAMHEERMKRQEAERQLQAFYEAERRRVEAAQKAAAEQKPVDPLLDPDGFARAQQERDRRLEAMVMQQQQAFQARQMQEARQVDVQRAEQAFRKENPDYDDAIAHVAQARAQELSMYGLSEQQIQAQISQDANAIYDSARRMNMNPAQLIYQIAQQRGYARTSPVEDETAKVEALATAQKQTQGLGSGGSRQAGRLTVTQLAEMSEAELAKLDPAVIERAFGA